MKCTKAIIPMAGYGTRRLPITKAVDKCMLPVGNRPIVDYVVEDCLKAGITDIIFVVSEQFEQLQSFYGRNLILEEYLKGRGKQKELDEIVGLAEKANFHYVVQDQHQPYGTAIPVALCADMIDEDEQVLVLMGDDFIYSTDGSSEAKHLIDSVAASGATAGLLATRVPKEELSKYGIIETATINGIESFKHMVEQPKVEDAPTDMINISKYIFDHKMMQMVKKVVDGQPAANGEFQVIEALNMYVADEAPVTVVLINGQYLDCGSAQGWLYANRVILGDL